MYDRDYGTSPIQVKRYTSDQESYLKSFCDEMKSHGLDNWSSLERLKTDKITYFVAYYKDTIVAINGLYAYDDNTWVVFARQATLPKYFRLLVPVKKWGSGSISGVFLAMPSINYALENGAKSLIATVNLDNSAGHDNDRNNRHAERMLNMGLWEYDGMRIHNRVKKDVYKINIESFKRFLIDLQDNPVRIRNENNRN